MVGYSDIPTGSAEHVDALLSGPARGRGAQLNPGNRFEDVRLHVLGEHLDELAIEHPDGRGVPTRVYADKSKTLLNRVDSPDLPFNWTINPYRGCEHGCIYCYARPGHEYLGMSCGLDFETRIMAKLDAPALARAEFGKPGWNGEHISLSGVTDCYQPIESRLRITRGLLEVCAEFAQPVGIVTKSRLITRDIDLLRELARHQAVGAFISITTLDNRLASAMEPRASAPRERLAAVRQLADAGIPVGVMTAPIIPGLNESEIPAILDAAADAGASGAGYTMLRLPHQIKALFLDWLKREFPDRAGKVESQLRDMRHGDLYRATFFERHKGVGARAEQVGQMFKVFQRKHNLHRKWARLSNEEFLRRKRVRESKGQLGLWNG
ncbi:MAG: PA0069 family radical SAM protein [Phycisphaerales bacterium]|nr:PA0069 family radical SAM protein [Phycisphaerales bacterium]